MSGSLLKLRVPLLVMLAAVMACGCQLRQEALAGLATQAPASPTPQPEWEALAKGLEWRTFVPDGDELAQLIVIRIDPSFFRFRALYSPGNPKPLSQWRDEEDRAAVIVNANFFDEARHILGALISDGKVYGEPDEYGGGSFLVRGGQPAVIANRPNEPNITDASIEQLVEGWPLLVDRGDPAYVDWSDSQRSRRTIIAGDSSGRILIMAAPWLGLSLSELGEYLTQAGLNILRAVNLDGGRSTMLSLPAASMFLPSFDAVPAILAVYPR